MRHQNFRATYRELWELVERAAKGLLARGNDGEGRPSAGRPADANPSTLPPDTYRTAVSG